MFVSLGFLSGKRHIQTACWLFQLFLLAKGKPGDSLFPRRPLPLSGHELSFLGGFLKRVFAHARSRWTEAVFETPGWTSSYFHCHYCGSPWWSLLTGRSEGPASCFHIGCATWWRRREGRVAEMPAVTRGPSLGARPWFCSLSGPRSRNLWCHEDHPVRATGPNSAQWGLPGLLLFSLLPNITKKYSPYSCFTADHIFIGELQ